MTAIYQVLSNLVFNKVKLNCVGLLFGAFAFHAVVSISAQHNQQLPLPRPSHLTDDKPRKCFEYALSLDRITQQTDPEKTIIVIARRGDKDSMLNLNKRRLYNIRAYWTEFLSEPIRRRPQTIVLAEGEPTKGYGQIEFYVGGELAEILKLIPNGDFPIAQCYVLPDEPECADEKQKIFYPCKDRIEKQPRKQKYSIIRKKRRKNRTISK